MMHLLPSTIKKDKIEDVDGEESSSYKKQKEAKDKANSARYTGDLWSKMAQPAKFLGGRNVCGSLQGLWIGHHSQ